MRDADAYSAMRLGVLFIPVAVATVAGAHTADRALARVSAKASAVCALAAAVIAALLVPSVLRSVPSVVHGAGAGRPAH